jgi:crotonobetainyl-CoA:carnitine CoA-transferase CaiB-like acyl-CoA transferase
MPAPLLGQQTVEILKEAGLSEDTIQAMLSEGSAKEYEAL